MGSQRFFFFFRLHVLVFFCSVFFINFFALVRSFLPDCQGRGWFSCYPGPACPKRTRGSAWRARPGTPRHEREDKPSDGHRFSQTSFILTIIKLEEEEQIIQWRRICRTSFWFSMISKHRGFTAPLVFSWHGSSDGKFIFGCLLGLLKFLLDINVLGWDI